MEKPTLAQRFIEDSHEVQTNVCTLMEWTMERYAQIQYETGLQFLYRWILFDDAIRLQMEKSKEFWSWWRLCWFNYDQNILAYKWSIEQERLIRRREIYLELHDVNRMIIDGDTPKDPVILSALKQKEVVHG